MLLRRIPLSLAAIGLLSLLILQLVSCDGPGPEIVLLGGTEGGTYESLARRTKGLLQGAPAGRVGLITIEESKGSRDNLRLLREGSADFGFVSGAALLEYARETETNVGVTHEPELAIVTRLDTDFVQVLVRSTDSTLTCLADFFEKSDSTRIYIGSNEGTGATDAVQRLIRLTYQGDLETRGGDWSYKEAATELENRGIDAGVFVGALQTPAVFGLMDSGRFRIVPLTRSREQLQAISDLTPHQITTLNEIESLDGVTSLSLAGILERMGDGLTIETARAQINYFAGVLDAVPLKKLLATIPKHEYPKQRASVRSVVIRTYMLCPSDLPNGMVELVTKTLYDNLYRLQVLHKGKEALRPEDAFDIPDVFGEVRLHPGALAARKEARQALLITTGAFGGKYHSLGQQLKVELAKLGVYSTVTHSQGSFENSKRLARKRPDGVAEPHEGPVIAIVQEDAGLLSKYGLHLRPGLASFPESGGETSIEHVPELSHIATLHPEKLHLLAKTPALEGLSPLGASDEQILNLL